MHGCAKWTNWITVLTVLLGILVVINSSPGVNGQFDISKQRVQLRSALGGATKSFEMALKEWMDLGMPDKGFSPIKQLMNVFKFQRSIQELTSISQKAVHHVRSQFHCMACHVVVDIVLLRLSEGATKDSIVKEVVRMCTSFNIMTERVCTGVVDLVANDLYFIFMHRNLTSATVCGMILQSYGCVVDKTPLEWTINTDMGTKPEVAVEKTSPNRPPGQIIRILQISDIHVDPFYQPGSNMKCKEPMCCREEHGRAKRHGDAAGFWGTLAECNIPYHTLKATLKHIARRHKDISLIYLSGDYVPHHLWMTSRKSNLEIIGNVTKMMTTYFPNTPVIPVLGNHEAHPVNSYAPPGVPSEFSADWLYEGTYNMWSHWIPPEAAKTYKAYGYYSYRVTKYFRVIVVNSNICYTFNWWILFESRDPGGQLEWIAKELLEAERGGEKVHILGHVAPGDDCWKIWAREFIKIVDRFEDTIVGQFYGHTHFDEFKVIFSRLNSTRASNHVFIAPSVTTFSQLNPGYRIYDVDGAFGANSTWQVLDYETWIFNVTRANLDMREPKWHMMYKAKQKYQLTSLLPKDYHKFVMDMVADEKLFNKFYRNYVKESDVMLAKGCDDMCRKDLLCDLLTTVYDESGEVCDQIYRSNEPVIQAVMNMMNLLTNNLGIRGK